MVPYVSREVCTPFDGGQTPLRRLKARGAFATLARMGRRWQSINSPGELVTVLAEGGTGELAVMPMLGFRLTAWNCAGAFHKKVAAVRNLAADLVVLSEVPAECVSLLGDVSGAWIGKPGKPGLAVIGFGGWQIARYDVAMEESLFLPVVASKGSLNVRILGVCVKPRSGYAVPTLAALRSIPHFLQGGAAVLGGDFNITAKLDNVRSPSRRFDPVADHISKLGFQSAWHTYQSENFGEESAPTYHHHWSQDASKGFHIDYVFVSGHLICRSAVLGTYADFTACGISDHVPLSVDIGLAA